MKENSFTWAKKKKKKEADDTSSQTILDVDDTDDIARLANTPDQAESLLHSLERAAGGICPRVKVDKTEYIRFNERGDISTLNGGPLKLTDNFTFQGSSFSATQNYMNTRLTKSGSALYRLLVYGSQTWTMK